MLCKIKKKDYLKYFHLKPIRGQYFALFDLIYSSNFCVCFTVNLMADISDKLKQGAV